MYLVTGGAFQGKRKWVKQHISDVSGPILWINGYVQEDYSINLFEQADIVVIEGLEELVRTYEVENHIEYWNHLLEKWDNWEQQKPTRKVIIIGCEIGLGIVPMDKRERQWRDIVGNIYQQIAYQAKVVVRIWCGIPDILKEEK